MRCFLAIPLPDNIKDVIKRKIKWVEGQEFFSGNYVSKDNIHITFKFLGDITAKDCDAICDKIKKSIDINKIKKFSAKINKTGFFPTIKNARIGWFGFEDEDKIIKLRENFDDIFGKDERFHPHITFIRIKKIIEKDFIKKLNIGIDETVKIERINLYKSELHKKGPVYSLIREIKLK